MKIFKLVCLVFAFGVFNIAWADAQVYTEKNLGFVVKADQPQFTIKLKSNPTTGYTWLLREYDTQLITPVRHEFVANKEKKLTGAPGYDFWTFQVKPEAFVVPQQRTIHFVYVRPWEGAGQSNQITFNVNLI